MIKNIILRVLKKLGYEIVKTKIPKAHIVNKEEISSLENDLKVFSLKDSSQIGKEAKGNVNWSKPEVVREYLNDERIASYHALLSVLAEKKINLNGQKILDIGSGTGYLMRLIFKQNSNVTLHGFDTYRELNTLASHLCPSAKFIEKDIFSIMEEKYDIVICTEVLEHLNRPDLALKNICSAVKNGSYIILTVPDGREDTFASIGAYPNKTGYWGHINFWSIESWNIFIEQHFNKKAIQTGEISYFKTLYAIITFNSNEEI